MKRADNKRGTGETFAGRVYVLAVCIEAFTIEGEPEWDGIGVVSLGQNSKVPAHR